MLTGSFKVPLKLMGEKSMNKRIGTNKKERCLENKACVP